MSAPLTRAEVLALRRRVVAAAQARRRPPRLPPALPPSGPLLAYERALTGLSDAMDDAILAVLREEGLAPRTDAEGSVPDLGPAVARRVSGKVQRALRRLLKDRSMVARIEEVAQSTARHSRAQWQKQVKASLGIDLPASDPDFGPLFQAFRRENTDLIVSLATDKVDRVRGILADAGTGTRVEEIAKSIRESTGATRSRAELIARDQVLKLNADVTRKRHEAAGVTAYTWSTSRDERVRESHKALDGQRIPYDTPPVVDPRTGRREHAGRDFQCRCIAEPIIPGFDD